MTYDPQLDEDIIKAAVDLEKLREELISLTSMKNTAYHALGSLTGSKDRKIKDLQSRMDSISEDLKNKLTAPIHAGARVNIIGANAALQAVFDMGFGTNTKIRKWINDSTAGAAKSNVFDFNMKTIFNSYKATDAINTKAAGPYADLVRAEEKHLHDLAAIHLVFERMLDSVNCLNFSEDRLKPSSTSLIKADRQEIVDFRDKLIGIRSEYRTYIEALKNCRNPNELKNVLESREHKELMQNEMTLENKFKEPVKEILIWAIYGGRNHRFNTHLGNEDKKNEVISKCITTLNSINNHRQNIAQIVDDKAPDHCANYLDEVNYLAGQRFMLDKIGELEPRHRLEALRGDKVKKRARIANNFLLACDPDQKILPENVRNNSSLMQGMREIALEQARPAENARVGRAAVGKLFGRSATDNKFLILDRANTAQMQRFLNQEDGAARFSMERVLRHSVPVDYNSAEMEKYKDLSQLILLNKKTDAHFTPKMKLEAYTNLIESLIASSRTTATTIGGLQRFQIKLPYLGRARAYRNTYDDSAKKVAEAAAIFIAKHNLHQDPECVPLITRISTAIATNVLASGIKGAGQALHKVFGSRDPNRTEIHYATIQRLYREGFLNQVRKDADHVKLIDFNVDEKHLMQRILGVPSPSKAGITIEPGAFEDEHLICTIKGNDLRKLVAENIALDNTDEGYEADDAVYDDADAAFEVPEYDGEADYDLNESLSMLSTHHASSARSNTLYDDVVDEYAEAKKIERIPRHIISAPHENITKHGTPGADRHAMPGMVGSDARKPAGFIPPPPPPPRGKPPTARSISPNTRSSSSPVIEEKNTSNKTSNYKQRNDAIQKVDEPSADNKPPRRGLRDL